MEHPVKEIPRVIHSLTQGSPSEQKAALEAHFLPTASFQHPFCRVPSFSDVSLPLLGVINSRWLIWMIFRWYKILSPKITLDVNSVVYDQKQQLLYVSISQIFSIFFIPFYHADVKLVTILHLMQDKENSRYYIDSQEDLYQLNEFFKFVWPGGALFATLWQWMVTGLCVLGAFVFAPITWLEEKTAQKGQ